MKIVIETQTYPDAFSGSIDRVIEAMDDGLKVAGPNSRKCITVEDHRDVYMDMQVMVDLVKILRARTTSGDLISRMDKLIADYDGILNLYVNAMKDKKQ